ncbi:DUF6503 family protein [Allomuricauda sp. SCSIO 65647]|uniref:DUF6503 family protein n=1 Tax=Allomuricauda sp. SCSIO 65647 TaxID=2908843 RepID=UPI001F23E45A|nr:DUF6503 family protein [Muricauda sp. SCSIO 65647]UJH67583.1 deoxyribose-phosphate aldolase [Muricauda sp. SCSIO 65647]
MKYLAIATLLFFVSCHDATKERLNAQQIIDKSIEASGGKLFDSHDVFFVFRDKAYVSGQNEGKKVLKRIFETDSVTITDVLAKGKLQRFFNDSLIQLPDSVANRYANSVNSVHYFVRLPYGLNDKAVNKKLLGESTLKEKDYYKVQITFDRENGGDDFEDIYIYWFDKETFKPDYLAYEFHVNGGGIRFREAFNERYVNGIRFVDYNNYKPKEKTADIYKIDSLFLSGALELLSKIELKDVKATKID